MYSDAKKRFGRQFGSLTPGEVHVLFITRLFGAVNPAKQGDRIKAKFLIELFQRNPYEALMKLYKKRFKHTVTTIHVKGILR